ncbi:hypothetical protein [Streptomyces sp. BE303]|uniref:hypothetical protein n=1 Tax=Streptomyces sp. BE303 TaxID=3002528 RepID=UPI002E79EC70|nr:hypothetical protein [Streptomyces sp. BE303]MED7954942.1 hypothetical protein [Streptomyces sp. BE303]
MLGAVHRSRVDVTALPPQLADAARSSPAAASRLGGPVADQARTAFVEAMRVTLPTGAGVVAPAAVAVALLPRRQRAGTAS